MENNWINKLKCMAVGHNWRYNFPSIPNKRICGCCELRQQKDLTTLHWFDGFKDERSNEILINKWFG